jgi:HEPN domain-containing protein
MKQITLEWIIKAEEDWQVALMSYRARKFPAFDAAVFHSQQCIEKYLKSRLVEDSINFNRTHDLLMLHNLVLQIEPTWLSMQMPLAFLNPFAVAFRYPGISATKADAKDAIKHCRSV